MIAVLGNKRKKNCHPWLLLPIIFWIGVIFFFSSQSGFASARLSSGFVRFCVNLLYDFGNALGFSFFDITSEEFLSLLHITLRKVAHFVEYAVLGVLSTRYFFPGSSCKHPKLCALLLSVSCAFLDEYYQTFVPGRGGCISDVLLDSGGVLFGVLMYAIWQQKQKE